MLVDRGPLTGAPCRSGKWFWFTALTIYSGMHCARHDIRPKRWERLSWTSELHICSVACPICCARRAMPRYIVAATNQNHLPYEMQALSLSLYMYLYLSLSLYIYIYIYILSIMTIIVIIISSIIFIIQLLLHMFIIVNIYIYIYIYVYKCVYITYVYIYIHRERDMPSQDQRDHPHQRRRGRAPRQVRSGPPNIHINKNDCHMCT